MVLGGREAEEHWRTLELSRPVTAQVRMDLAQSYSFGEPAGEVEDLRDGVGRGGDMCKVTAVHPVGTSLCPSPV